MKNFFRYFLYASLIFLVYALIKADYLKIPVLFSYSFLGLSFITLFAGFITYCISWKKTLEYAGYPVSTAYAISSTGLSVFGKYIPGKIWMILGEAGYLSNIYGYPIDKLVSANFNAQLLSLWTGLLTGSAGLYMIDGFGIWGMALGGLWVALTVILFTNFLHRFAEAVLKKILGKEYTIPQFTFSEIIKLLPSYFGFWFFWALSFCFFSTALSPQPVSAAAGLGFPLSVTLGIIVIISPGGIGVREGFLVSYLTLAGFDLAYATTVAVASRLWYLAGEFFIFLAGFFLDRRKKKVIST